MAKEFKEKTITVNLSKVFEKPETKRARGALKILKDKITKETRAKNIKINNSVNQAIWERGLFKSLRKITVKIIQEKDNIRVYLPEDKIVEEKKQVTKKETVKEVKVETPKEETAKPTKTVEKK